MMAAALMPPRKSRMRSVLETILMLIPLIMCTARIRSDGHPDLQV